MITSGLIGFSYSPGWLQRCIRFFTNSKWSHAFVTIDVAGSTSVMEAGQFQVQVVPYHTHYKGVEHELYQIKQVTAWDKDDEADERLALLTTFYALAGDRYGYLQCLWFVWRWLNDKLGRDISQQKNWFTRGVICDEVVYYYLWNLSDAMHPLLSKFSPDTIQSEDLYQIVKSNPQMFEKVNIDV